MTQSQLIKILEYVKTVKMLNPIHKFSMNLHYR